MPMSKKSAKRNKDRQEALKKQQECEALKKDEELEALRKNARKTIPQVSLRWLLQKNVVCSVIIGATSLKQLEDNMGASTGWSLSEKDMSRLDAAGRKVDLYPYDLIWRINADRINPFNTSD